MSDIGVKQIRPLLEECKAHGAWAAIHVKGDLSAIFEFAVVRGLVEANPIPSLYGLLCVPVNESKAAMARGQIHGSIRHCAATRAIWKPCCACG